MQVSGPAARASQALTKRLEIRRQISTIAASAQPDSKTLLIALLYEYMTGPKARLFLADPSAGFGVSYSRQEVHTASDSSTFHAEGTLHLKSGVPIAFSLHLEMNRQATQVNSAQFSAGNMLHPLVLSFAGGSSRDVAGDGNTEWTSALASVSAWLSPDTNGNGKMKGGRQSFGSRGSDSFVESAVDSDPNGGMNGSGTTYSRTVEGAGADLKV